VTAIGDSQLRAASLAKAAQLARQGRYAEAQRVLGELGGRDSLDLDLLDLLARVHAQQGELALADECWARAQEVSADEPSPREGRRRIAQIYARRYRRRTDRAVGAVVLAVVLLAGAGVAGAAVAQISQSTDPALLSELRETKAAKGDLTRQVGELRSRLDQVTLRPEQVLRDIRAELAGSGLILESESGVLVVAFPVGLFPNGARLSTEGRGALADLGVRLSRFNGDVSFTVIGHTDEIPVSPYSQYVDNEDLGFARARVAAQELSANSRIPLTRFAVTSSGAVDPPFPISTAEDHKQNRTVVLWVHPRQRDD